VPKQLERFAPALFVFLWSTGFVGAKYIVPYAEPFTFLTIRYVIAAAILIAIAALLKQPLKLTRDQVIASVAVGLLLHVIYIGGVFYAVSLGVSAGISAVIVSIQPVLVSILAVPLLGERIRSVQVVGLVLGVAGIALLLLPKVFQGDYSSAISEVGIVICVIALLGTSAGYLVQKKLGGDIPFLTGTGLQYAVSAVVFALLSALTEDQRVEWSPEFLFGLAWIVLMLSIGSIVLLYEMLRAGSASKVSSLYYLVPPVAAIQAYFLFDEVIPPIGILGMALAGLGVVLVMRQAVEKTSA
jgi:drug/metabolite transporter (DMT)-like permease